jgi:microcin C transport system substrate-binding protein
MNDFDYDVVSRRFSMSPTPGEGLRQMLGSAAARIPGTNNLSGIADPAIDALVEKVVGAQSRADLTFATRALDRVVRAGRYWVPAWYKGSHTLAFWDVYARPAEKPRYARGFETTWWWDEAKANRLGIPG